MFNIYGFSLPFTAVYNHKNIFVFIFLQYIGIQVVSKINRFPCPLQSAVVETRWGMQIPVNILTLTALHYMYIYRQDKDPRPPTKTELAANKSI